MKKPQVSDCLPPGRAFYVSRSMLGNRLDAEFFQPKHYRLLEEMNTSGNPLLALRKIAKRVVDGPFGSAIKAEDYTDEGIPFLRVADVTRGEGNIKTDDLAFISHEAHKRILRSRVRPGDVIVAKTGATMGAASLIPSSLPEANIRADLAAITLNDPERAQYLVNFINTRMGYQLFWRLNSGATRGRVVIENLREYPILWPSDEVCKEVNLQVAQARQGKKRKEAAAEDLLATIDDVLLDELGIPRLPEPPNTLESRIFRSSLGKLTGQRWDAHFYHPRFKTLEQQLGLIRTVKIRFLATKIFSGITPLSGGDAYVDSEDGVAFIRSGDFATDGTIDEDSLIHLRREIHNGLMASSKLRKHDVLFAIVGATIGKVGIFTADYEANINQAVCAVRFDDYLIAQFVHAFFLGSIGQTEISRLKRPVARANVNLEEVGSLRVPILEQKQRERIIHRVFEIQKNVKLLREQASADLERAKRDIEALILGKDNEDVDKKVNS